MNSTLWLLIGIMIGQLTVAIWLAAAFPEARAEFVELIRDEFGSP